LGAASLFRFGFVIFWHKNIGAKAAHKNADDFDYCKESISSTYYGNLFCTKVTLDRFSLIIVWLGNF
jgi:hypothetical protein